MQRVLYIFLLFSSVAMGQQGYRQEKKIVYTDPVSEAKILRKEDFKLSNGRMQVTDRACTVKDEKGANTIVISVVCQQKAFNQLGVEKINEMIRIANDKVRNSVQFDHQYNPQEIKMVYIPDSQDWSLTNTFTVQDEDGFVSQRLLSLNFDSQGKFEVMKKIL